MGNLIPGDGNDNWKTQLRGNDGRWINMYGPVSFDYTPSGGGPAKKGQGTFQGVTSPGRANIFVKDDPELEVGMYEVQSQFVRGVKAFIPTSGGSAKPKPEVEPKQTELKNEITGDEAMQIVRNAGAEYARSQGRFAMARTYNDVKGGLRAQYAQLFDGIKQDNPELLKNKFIINEDGTGRTGDVETEDDFWGALRALEAGTSSRWVSPEDIDPLAKEVNRRYAEKFLGLKKDGLITFYRNAINEKENPADAAAGYISLDRKMAWDYNSQKSGTSEVNKGRYIVKAKPDEVLGILGLSGATDEFGVVISPEVTSLPGRFERVGDLEKQIIDTAPWVSMELLDEEPRSLGGSPFRFLAPMANFDYYALDSNPFGEGSGWSSFYEANGLEKGAMPNKYNELYGEGAWEKDFGDGSPRASSFADLFIEFTDEQGNKKWGLNGLALRKLSNQDMLNNAESGDDFDRNIKVLSVMQELMGKPFFVNKGHDQSDPRIPEKPAEVAKTPEPAPEVEEPDTTDVAAGYKPSEYLEVLRLDETDEDEYSDVLNDAIEEYAGTGFNYMNDYLRGNIADVDDEVKEQIDALQEHALSTTLPEAMSFLRSQTTWGGYDFVQQEDGTYSLEKSTSSGEKEVRSLESIVGEKWTSKGFLSTTTELSGGKPLKNRYGKDMKFQMHILAPKGSNGVTLGFEEREFLMPHGLSYKVVKADAVDGQANIWIELDPPSSKPKAETERETGLFNEYSPERADEITAENTPLTDLGFDPEEEITIYRGVPEGVDSINDGDWVTTLPQLAKDYAGGDGKVVSSKVKAKDLLADPSSGEGAYTEEMVYRPKTENVEAPKDREVSSREMKQEFDTNRESFELKDEVAKNLLKRIFDKGVTREELVDMLDSLGLAKFNGLAAPDSPNPKIAIWDDTTGIVKWEGSKKLSEVRASAIKTVTERGKEVKSIQSGNLDLALLNLIRTYQVDGAKDNIPKFTESMTYDETIEYIRKLNNLVDERHKNDTSFSSHHEIVFEDNVEKAKDLMSYSAVSNMVSEWAGSSNDESAFSLALQDTVAKLFNLENYLPWTASKLTSENKNALIELHGKVISAYAESQYEATQEKLKSKGITSVQLYRGMYSPEIRDALEEYGYLNNDLVILRPLSSFSYDIRTAESFSGDEKSIVGLTYVQIEDDPDELENVFGSDFFDTPPVLKPNEYLDIYGKVRQFGSVVLDTVVPADRIFSMPFSGVGCLSESEVVVLGPNLRAEVIRPEDAEELANQMDLEAEEESQNN